ncbi:MAG: hypothetical protein QOD33_1687 [Pyrinomonadaceae bacterium]|jgi:hypothetical protein|nr:hypothetical protein [Pyrinomonadaceae bacterium]
MPESGGKTELKWASKGAIQLDSRFISGGKCGLSNGSGKSPALNQFTFRGIMARLVWYSFRRL